MPKFTSSFGILGKGEPDHGKARLVRIVATRRRLQTCDVIRTFRFPGREKIDTGGADQHAPYGCRKGGCPMTLGSYGITAACSSCLCKPQRRAAASPKTAACCRHYFLQDANELPMECVATSIRSQQHDS